MAALPGDLEIIDLRRGRGDPTLRRRDEALLRGFHRRVYKPAFPIVSEQESPNEWIPRIWEDPPESAWFELHPLIAGRTLDRPRRRRLYGALFFEYYWRSSCALVTYLVVAPRMRRLGLARHLLAESRTRLRAIADARHGSEAALRAVFTEVNDPSKVKPEDDSIDPVQRMAAFERLGARIVDIPYVQPELAPGQGRARELFLLVFPLPGSPDDSIAAETVGVFIDDFYRANGVAEPAHDPDVRAMIEAMPGADVRLIRPSLHPDLARLISR
jgi:GNAT superfamily N-acetyltransferase